MGEVSNVTGSRTVVKFLTLLLLIACFATSAWASPKRSQDQFAAFARACGFTSEIQQKPRVLASPNESSWHEYPSFKDIPDWASQWIETAAVWRRDESGTLVEISGVGQDFADDSYYCSDARGILTRLTRHFRTAWRWGLEETIMYDKKGDEEERTSRYFDTKDKHTLEPPAESDLVTPLKVFSKVSTLPFFSLFDAGNAKTENQKENLENGDHP
jgi:hypothetical protein